MRRRASHAHQSSRGCAPSARTGSSCSVAAPRRPPTSAWIASAPQPLRRLQLRRPDDQRAVRDRCSRPARCGWSLSPAYGPADAGLRRWHLDVGREESPPAGLAALVTCMVASVSSPGRSPRCISERCSPPAGDTASDTAHLALALREFGLFLAAMCRRSFRLSRADSAFPPSSRSPSSSSAGRLRAPTARIADNEPTPWIGIVERVAVFGSMLWIAARRHSAHALVLARRQRLRSRICFGSAAAHPRLSGGPPPSQLPRSSIPPTDRPTCLATRHVGATQQRADPNSSEAAVDMETLVSLCKRRGFVFQSQRDLRRPPGRLGLRPAGRRDGEQHQARLVAGDGAGARRHRRASTRRS